MPNHSVPDDDTRSARRLQYRAAARLIRHAVTKKQVGIAFGVAVGRRESVFDALVRTQVAPDLYAAIALVGRRFPAPSPAGTGWLALAAWVVDYECHLPESEAARFAPRRGGHARRRRARR